MSMKKEEAGVKYITFDETRPMDLVLLGRIAVDFNPVDYFQPLEDCTTFMWADLRPISR